MNKTLNSVLRIRLVTLCCAGAVWATAGLGAQAAPPAFGAHGFHNGFHNGFNGNFNGGNGFGSWGNAWGGWGGELYGLELNEDENRIPFYALHPPVYYSYPIARPYGDSPFASPPAYYGPSLADGGPQTIVNPYAAPGNAAPSSGSPSPPAPSSPSPNAVKPTAGRTASLAEEASPTIETLPTPEPTSLVDSDASADSNVHVVLNPYVK